MKVIKGYLAPDLLIEGKAHTTDSARIDCTCVGKVTGDQEVDFGESAQVVGEVSAKVVRMSGKMEGNLTVQQKVSLLGSSRVKGNLITPPGEFSMDLGSEFEGNFQIVTPETTATAKAAEGKSAAQSKHTAAASKSR